ncbi:MAG: orotate phosphoribosyltransferase [Kiritimatiellae bacterium]|nr:orotate phosphoribosyltransferase [Kiritimatiellia bacterium]
MTEETALSILRETGALLSGHFELRSGLHSGEFFQCANVLRFPRKAAALCEELCKRLPEDLASQAGTVVSPALGGILVGHEVARALDKKCIFAEKQDGALAMRRFKIEPGERCIVAEDVVTRGGRVQETIDIVRAAGGVVLAVLTIVDRSGGKASFGEIPHFSLLRMAPVVYDPASCPLCAGGSKAIHPGS